VTVNGGRPTRVLVLAGLLMAALAARAQVQVGDNLNMNLNGTLSFGYTADYGNLTASDHGLTAGGNANLTGYYYSPGLATFNIQPFYNQSRSNSSFQSISDASGINANISLFNGTHYPGSISYSKLYNSEGNFAVPGLADYKTHGNSDTLSLGWGVNKPDWPSLAFNYQQGHDNYSIYGSDTNSSSAFRSFTSSANYLLEGFNLNGNFHYSASHLDLPLVTTGQVPETSSSDGTSFSLGAAHRLPFHGNFSAAFSHADVTSNFDGQSGTGSNYDFTVNTASVGMAFAPIRNLNLGMNSQYTDNLEGTLYQSILGVNGLVQQNTPGQSSHALDLIGYAGYTMEPIHLTLNVNTDHREQALFGTSLSSDAYTGSATYSNYLWGGTVSATGGVTHNSVSNQPGGTLGFLSGVNYSRTVGKWNVGGSGNYSRNTQTVLIAYTTSGYGFTASASRLFGRGTTWSAAAAGNKIALNNLPGYGTFSQSYSTTFSLRWIGVSGAFSKSDGNGLLTGTGVTPTPVPVPVVPSTAIILYGGQAWSVGVGGSPIRGLQITSSYSKARSDTFSSQLASNNRTDQLNARVQYQFRKMYFTAGYARLVQGFSASPTPPAMLGSYYVGITRWFDFF
jgi:hypothetical protein